MLRLKKGVRVTGLRPELLLAITIAASIYEENKYECVVTSLVDQRHGHGSLHFSGCAVDLRIRHLLDDDVKLIVKELSSALGVDYDVVLESDHIHLEYQPKTK